MCGVCGCGGLSPVAPSELKNFSLVDSNAKRSNTLSFTAAGGSDGTPGVDAHSVLGALSEVNESARLIEIEQGIQSKNNFYAQKNRDYFELHHIHSVNLLSSPGSGKTSLLVKTLTDLKGELPLAVIEGDQQTDLDAQRIAETGTLSVQINTGKGCHLEAQQVGEACLKISPPDSSILFIENVGNLVCPAAFYLGEHLRVVVLSVTEGEDKPLKYPDMFIGADVILLNKIDLLPYLDFDLVACENMIRKVNQKAQLIQLSVKTGQGMEQWYNVLTAMKSQERLDPAESKTKDCATGVD